MSYSKVLVLQDHTPVATENDSPSLTIQVRNVLTDMRMVA
jgi:hypothetical protein